jgi:hypothetical protein
MISSVALGIATGVIWIDSYWRGRCINWVHDTPRSGGLFRIKISVFYLRGGFMLGLTKENATTSESVRDLQYYYQWHPPLEMWSDSVAAIDAVMRQQTWRESYLFMPTTPSTLGFQVHGRRGVYQGDYLWDGAVAVPFWFPLSLCSATAVLLAWHERKYRRQISKELCPVCKYDLRATPDRCPECGFETPAKKVSSLS